MAQTEKNRLIVVGVGAIMWSAMLLPLAPPLVALGVPAWIALSSQRYADTFSDFQRRPRPVTIIVLAFLSPLWPLLHRAALRSSPSSSTASVNVQHDGYPISLVHARRVLACSAESSGADLEHVDLMWARLLDPREGRAERQSCARVMEGLSGDRLRIRLGGCETDAEHS